MARKTVLRVVRDRHEGKRSMPFLAEVAAAQPAPRRRKRRARRA